jgi:DNA recombination protein RmuC
MSFEVLLIVVLVIGFVGLAIFLKSLINSQAEKNKPSEEMLRVMTILQEGSKQDRKMLLDSLWKNSQSLNERLDNAARVIGSVQKQIGEMSEIGRGMKEIHAFLHSPKLRGNIGEQVLKELLSQLLPQQSFKLQHRFKSGAIVDAAILTQSGIIPIDSKFPMENFRGMIKAELKTDQESYQRLFVADVKRHIKTISEKYILNDEGTIDYALMYIPTEAVYYEIVNDTELYEASTRARVLPVSPTTFYAFLKAILMSFEGQKIEKQAQEILRAFRSVQKDYEKLGDNLSLLTKHVTNAYNTTTAVFSQFTLLGQKIDTANKLDKPKQLEIEEDQSI